ncbi:MAG: glycosyltransferase family 2 protein [Acidobacteria bacterium]|nr:glycosyltransferase family 2 protein [Acidobacteriota bacterium]
MVPLSIIIHCLNEEKNISFALESVCGWADQIFVVDSGSIDRTLAIAERYSAHIVPCVGNRENLVELRNWALATLPIRNEWVFILDADEVVPNELKAEVASIVTENDAAKDGYWCRFKLHFMGRWIKRASMYPSWSLRLFRHAKVRYERRDVNSHPLVPPARAGYLTRHIINDDRRGFQYYVKWIDEFSTLEASAYLKVRLNRSNEQLLVGRLFGARAARRRFLKNLFVRLPLRPALIFIYLYVLRGGLLEGRAGFDYCFLKAVTEWMITVKMRERIANTPPCDSRKSEGAGARARGLTKV